MAEENSSSPVLARSAQGLRRSKTLWLALLITLGGAVWWAYSAFTAPKAAPAPGASALVDPGSTAGRARIKTEAPGAFRYGASFMGAFLIAYMLKKVIRSVLLIAALLVGAIMTLKYFGILNYDWSSAQQQVEQGVGYAREEGERYRAAVMGYLPSGLAAGAGAIFGARRG
jgi:uncharacterized membrane protein (Fun14 family)